MTKKSSSRSDEALPKSKSRSSTSLLLFTILFLPFMGFVMQKLNAVQQVERPPADFGSGQMFDHIASRYDLINRVLALRMDVGWRSKMITEIRARVPSDKARILDVATGTADVALQLANDIPSSTVLGVDPSNNMLNFGREKVSDQNLQDRIELVTGDARKMKDVLPHDDQFDAATMAFGIRNVPEREVALCEIHRVMKKGATIGILEFSEPDNSHGILGRLARLFIRYIVPVVGAALSGAAQEYVHLQNSIQDFPSPTEFQSLMQNLECGGVKGNYFDMEEVVHMNFGSVQLYLGTAMKPDAIETFCRQAIDAHDVVIFSKSYCPHCRATKDLFANMNDDTNSIDIKIYDLDKMNNGREIQTALLAMTGQRTVPNIFVKKQHIGGNSDIQLAAKNGKLHEMLRLNR